MKNDMELPNRIAHFVSRLSRRWYCCPWLIFLFALFLSRVAILAAEAPVAIQCDENIEAAISAALNDAAASKASAWTVSNSNRFLPVLGRTDPVIIRPKEALPRGTS